MKNFLIPHYRPTAKFWQVIIGLHLGIVICAGFTWHKKIVYDSMIIEMGSKAPLGTQHIRPGTQSLNQDIQSPLPQHDVREALPVEKAPDAHTQVNNAPLDPKEKEAVKAHTLEEKPAEKGIKKIPEKKLASKEKESKKPAAHEKNLSKILSKEQKTKTTASKSAMQEKPQNSAAQKHSAIDMLNGSYGTSIANAIDDELGAVGSNIQGFETAITDIKSHVTAFWNLPSVPPKGAFVTFHIILDSTGELVSVKKIASSGNGLLDASAQMAIEQASPFPLPQDPVLRKDCLDMELTLRPE